MNRGKRTLVAGVLALVLALGAAASAQQADTTLQRYDLAMQNLGQAVAAVPNDSAQARNDLDHAVNSLLTLSHDTTSATLVKAMEALFDRARAAVANQSRTDIAVQAAVLTGGFQRLVMDSAFKAAVAGDMTTAKARLAHIGADMQLDQGALDAIQAARTPTALRLQMEQGVARLISEDISVARRLLPTDRGVAYQTLAEGYGASLLVQDSPRVKAGFNQGFVDAAKALVAKDDAAFDKATRDIAASAGQLAEADRLALASTSSTTTATTSGNGAAPSALPAVAGAASGTAGSAPAARPPSAAAPAQAPASGSASGGQAASQAPAAGPEQQRQQQLTTLTQAIARTGMAAPAAQHLAASYLDAGTTSIQEATRAVYAATAEASASLMAGDVSGARDQVKAASKQYDSLLSPIVAFKQPGVDADTRATFTRTASLVGLRLQDLDNLTAQVDAAARVISGKPQSGNLALNRSLDSWWAGWPRLLVLLVFGILVFVPLYLLNMAFGGGNRNWQLIGVSLFLLLLPVVFEALAALGSMLASWTHTDSFEVLANYSMFQSTIGQVVWAGLIVLAILFAILGLYGICVQFGLLGRGKRSAGAGTTMTATATSTSTQERAEAMVDWDEEF
ncbi:MAG TPA: hypothetical protein VKB31_08810 [Trueperaceae bacterium]|nr:hypothetical protein [Trueperaceae bacterium]